VLDVIVEPTTGRRRERSRRCSTSRLAEGRDGDVVPQLTKDSPASRQRVEDLNQQLKLHFGDRRQSGESLCSLFSASRP